MNRSSQHRGIQDTQTILRDQLMRSIMPGDLVIDATAGRGRDTLFLAQCVGENGRVFAFDIQEEALLVTQTLLEEHHLLDRVELVHESHSEISQFVPQGIKAAVFNLGYLPGSTRVITTRPETTVQAVKQSLGLLTENGIVALTVYRGHEGGLGESKAIIDFLTLLPKKDFSVLQGIYLNQGELSPYWIMIQKTGGH